MILIFAFLFNGNKAKAHKFVRITKPLSIYRKKQEHKSKQKNTIIIFARYISRLVLLSPGRRSNTARANSE